MTYTPFVGEAGRCVVVEVEAEGRHYLAGKTLECSPRVLDFLPACTAVYLRDITDITSTRCSQVFTASVRSHCPLPILKS